VVRSLPEESFSGWWFGFGGSVGGAAEALPTPTTTPRRENQPLAVKIVSAPLFVHSQIVLLLPWHAFAVFFLFFPIRFCFVNTHRHTHTPGRRRTHGYTYTSAAASHTHTHLGQRERSLSRVELNASAFQVQVSYPYL